MKFKVITDTKIWKEIIKNLKRDLRGGKYDLVPLGFLDEEITVDDHGYSGDEYEYFFSRSKNCFIRHKRHWDAGNMFSNRLWDEIVFPDSMMSGKLGEYRRFVIENLTDPKAAEELSPLLDEAAELILSKGAAKDRKAFE